MTTQEIHPDMLDLIKAMGARWLTCAPGNGFWHQLGGGTAVIGWLDLVRHAILPDALEEVFSCCSEVNRIFTFAPENGFSKENYPGAAFHFGAEFIYATKPLRNESEDFYGIQFCDQIKDVKAAGYNINVADDYSVSFKEEHYFSALNGSPFIVAYEEAETVCGTVLVHGVTTNRCWMRRLFLQPRFRRKGLPKNIVMGALFLAEKKGFQVVSILVAKRIWDKGWFASLGFAPEKTVKHITVVKI